jgi:hypothetical protein
MNMQFSFDSAFTVGIYPKSILRSNPLINIYKKNELAEYSIFGVYTPFGKLLSNLKSILNSSIDS